MRKRTARSLRKWADLIDPRVKPTADGTAITVNVECIGAEEFAATIDALTAKLAGLVETGEKLKGIV